MPDAGPSTDAPSSAPSGASTPADGTTQRDERERISFTKLLRDGMARGAQASLNTIPGMLSRAETVGQRPGEITFVGQAPSEPPRLTVIDYDPSDIAVYEPDEPDALLPLRDSKTTTWINLDGLHDTTLIEKIGELFHLNPLLLEDVANTGQRPKVESYVGEDEEGNPVRYFFVVVKMLTYDEETQALHSEQVSLACGPGWVISFQERRGDVFDPIRERLRTGRGRVRTSGSEYLTYVLLDIIVDHYFLVLEAFGERTEDLDEEIASDDPDTEIQQEINRMRRDLIAMRRAVWPTRELFDTMQRGRLSDGSDSDEPFIPEDVRPFLRDTHDHAVQVIDILESMREVVSGLSDLYMSTLSHRMNEVMQVLTIIGTIFIPLTFIAGIYGMNFEYMPELQWRYSYFVAMGAMGVISIVLLAYFRKKGWL